jgi:hypothetical protein
MKLPLTRVRISHITNRVIFLAAFPTEGQREQNSLAALTRNILVTFGSNEAIAFAFKRRVNGVAFADELVQAKCENREAGLRILDCVTGEQAILQHSLASSSTASSPDLRSNYAGVNGKRSTRKQ